MCNDCFSNHASVSFHGFSTAWVTTRARSITLRFCFLLHSFLFFIFSFVGSPCLYYPLCLKLADGCVSASLPCMWTPHPLSIYLLARHPSHRLRTSTHTEGSRPLLNSTFVSLSPPSCAHLGHIILSVSLLRHLHISYLLIVAFHKYEGTLPCHLPPSPQPSPSSPPSILQHQRKRGSSSLASTTQLIIQNPFFFSPSCLTPSPASWPAPSPPRRPARPWRTPYSCPSSLPRTPSRPRRTRAPARRHARPP